jgi:CRP-like cAMP-binding protein
MVADASYATSLMIQKLESIFSLSPEEKQALQDLPVQIETLKPEQDIVRIGDQPTQCCLLLEGFTCVYKLTSEGKRQILALHVPGDMPDLQSLHLKVLDISIASISSSKVAFISHHHIRDVCERYPRLTAAFWRETLVDASIYRDWILNIGQRDAYSRVAHLLCELLMRLQAVGHAEDNAFRLPITQAQMADAIGITSVHMNRVFQALRSDDLIDAPRGKVMILDWERLQQEGDFDPLYLHLRKPHPDR